MGYAFGCANGDTRSPLLVLKDYQHRPAGMPAQGPNHHHDLVGQGMARQADKCKYHLITAMKVLRLPYRHSHFHLRLIPFVSCSLHWPVVKACCRDSFILRPPAQAIGKPKSYLRLHLRF